MKNKSIKNIVLVLFSLLLCESALAETKEENKTELHIETHKKIVKGFPVILKIKTKGLQRIPKISLFDKSPFGSILFVSKGDGKTYTISPPRKGVDRTLTETHSNEIGHIQLKPGEKRTKLLDISSLVSHRKGTTLDDIPPGKYSVSLKFSLTGITSNEINVEIVEPSKAEKNYLQNIRKSCVALRGEKEIVWAKFLLNSSSIPEKGLSKLSIDAQNQLRFHVLLSKVLRIAKLRGEVGRIGGLVRGIREIIDSSKVQDFLRSEKECLKLQFYGRDDKKKALIKRYPGLAWRLNKSQQEERGFLKSW